jgi:hypothetical protein
MFHARRKGIYTVFLHSGKFVLCERDSTVLIELFPSSGVGILTLWRQEDECLRVSVTGSERSEVIDWK